MNREETNEVKQYLLHSLFPINCNDISAKKKFKRKCEHFEVLSDVLYFKDKKNGLSRFYAKDDFKEKLQKVSEFHCISHLGRDKMEIGLKNRIYGVSREEIMAVLSSCKTCQVKKLLTTKPIIKPIIYKNPRDRYLADMIDLRHYASVNNGFAWILVIVDSYSKYIYCVPCYRKSAIEVSQALVKMFRILGPPLIFHTDNGKEFKNQLVSDVCAQFRTKQIQGRARFPWVQGQVERANKTIKSMLSSVVYDKPTPYVWISELDSVIFRYNNERHLTTRCTPMSLFLGYKEPKLLSDKTMEMFSEISGDIDDLSEELLNESGDCLNPANLNKLQKNDSNDSQESLIVFDDSELHIKAQKYTDIAALRMIEKRKWKNDYLEFNLNDEVFLKDEFDSNKSSKKMPLDDYVDRKIYVISDIIQHNLVNLRSKDNHNHTVSNISTSRLKKVQTLDNITLISKINK